MVAVAGVSRSFGTGEALRRFGSRLSRGEVCAGPWQGWITTTVVPTRGR
ncbi:MAG: hypothetical protein AVDCRST_MAG25-2373 [uncultured Rubrobacteraceae bacterium]|uniref:Uncharacterized protein n=1 Tax=uncultured Rubrobacteraceae bacterium TaxID=349277 RepID=A0A6J4RT94_9ACTN|nr:MAG: hypothetical protein AVDCRST_MAG25-2373 [uncultured Rubrobacteraceae bacterium]